MKIKMMNKESQKALNFFQIERLKSAYMDEWKDTEITIDLLAEYLENSAEIEQSSGARHFWQWLRNATGKNGFLEVVR